MIIKQKWCIHRCFEVITMFSMPKPELGYPNDGRSLDGQIELQWFSWLFLLMLGSDLSVLNAMCTNNNYYEWLPKTILNEHINVVPNKTYFIYIFSLLHNKLQLIGVQPPLPCPRHLIQTNLSFAFTCFACSSSCLGCAAPFLICHKNWKWLNNMDSLVQQPIRSNLMTIHESHKLFAMVSTSRKRAYCPGS